MEYPRTAHSKTSTFLFAQLAVCEAYHKWSADMPKDLELGILFDKQKNQTIYKCKRLVRLFALVFDFDGVVVSDVIFRWTNRIRSEK